MNQHRSSASEGIWIGLCVLLLLLLAGAGGFGYVQLQRANAAFDAAQRAQEMAQQADDEWTMQANTSELAEKLSAARERKLEQRVAELEAENRKLREQLKGAGE